MYDNVLIMSPWNYPFLLSISPLANAIAAGNTAVIKPSAYSPATSNVIARLIGDCFKPEYVAVVTGGRQENAALLNSKFDTVIHLATSEMGFGGVGESGMGAYHGREGFNAFSHTKSIVDKKTWLDLPMRYQPYKKGLYGKLLHIFLR